MMYTSEIQKTVSIKPFLKWAGGKTQLLPVLDCYLPVSVANGSDFTYIEPFVGGGAMLFHVLRKYKNIKKAIVNDVNERLIVTYKVIKEAPYELIEKLNRLNDNYIKIKDVDGRKEFYLEIRERFNKSGNRSVEDAGYMIFLNRTCFNGLYRENSKGHFNVPFGKYRNPLICDADTILSDSEILQKVDLKCGDYSEIIEFADKHSFVYIDPPYRPLDATSSFNSYVKGHFDDAEQLRLKCFVDELDGNGCKVLLSNSDCRSRNPEDLFFDNLYKDYIIERVLARRSINAVPSKRGKLTELLIRNYQQYQGVIL